MEKKSRQKYCTILKAKISVTNMEDALRYLTGNLEELRGNYVCVANVHTTVMAFRDEEYRRIQNAAAMALPDGKPLSIISRRRGFYDAKRVAGPDLMPLIFEQSREKGYRHYFYGSTKETLTKLRHKLTERYPDLIIAGMYSPPFRPLTREEDNRIVKEINDARPDFIWVALGAPKQEKWMAAHKGRLNGLMLGVGAAFDFTAGTVRRAPRWMQELCLEWLFRIMQDPIRLIPRYFNTNLSYMWHSARETRAYKKANKGRKVAMIGHKRIPSREGGVEVVVDELASRLVERGYRVEAYNRAGYHISGKEFEEKRSKVYNGIRLITVPTFRNVNLNAICYAGLATVRALFGGYGVIHYHAEGPCIMLGIPHFFGIRVVATIHGLDWQRAKWGGFASAVLKSGERMAAQKADAVIVLSANVRRYFKSTYGRDVTFIPNGIVRPKPQAADLITQKYGLEKDGYILFLARLVPEKGAHYLIEAYEQLAPDKKLVIAGGHSQANEYMKRINGYADKNPDIIITGFVQGQELAELLANAYLFVLPSDVEGMALSLLEAMSYGNCCLVSDIHENVEVVEQHAVSFHHGDVADLKAKLKMLLDDQDLVEHYRSESSDFICNKYNWEEIVDRTEALYQK